MGMISIISEPYVPTGKEQGDLQLWASGFLPVDMQKVLRRQKDASGYEQAVAWWKKNPSRGGLLPWCLFLSLTVLLILSIAVWGDVSAYFQGLLGDVEPGVLALWERLALGAVGLGFLFLIITFCIWMACVVKPPKPSASEQVWSIEEAGISVSDCHGATLMRWRLLCGWQESEGLLPLLDVHERWQFIPKAAFTDEQIEGVRDELRERLPKVEVKKR